jgi:hypothetical protein
MNREQMIEKAATEFYYRIMIETRDEWPLFEYLPEVCQQNHRDDARKLLDAILPQVTTVEELEALPAGSVVLVAGDPFVRRSWGWSTPTGHFASSWDLANSDSPPVVWQP